jgi:hypothetical protein
MSHLMESTRRMAENDPAIVKIRRVPVGNRVVYHGRMGSMRQGRTEFPAIVLKQHEDDGSLDLIVEYEAEDRIWEQRVKPYSEAQPGHCYTHVEPIDPDPEAEFADETERRFEVIKALVRELKQQMYGDYEAPDKSMIEYLDDFDQRLKKVEKMLRK